MTMTIRIFLILHALLLMCPTASADVLRRLRKKKKQKAEATPAPTDPPTAAPTAAPVAPQPKCGCDSCTAEVWSHPAGGSFPCGDRIEWKMTEEGGGLSEEEACRFVSNEYSDNECGPYCHPDLCDLTVTPGPSPAPSTAEPTDLPTATPTTSEPTGSPSASPTPSPTMSPSASPTKSPTAGPSTSPPTGTYSLGFVQYLFLSSSPDGVYIKMLWICACHLFAYVSPCMSAQRPLDLHNCQ